MLKHYERGNMPRPDENNIFNLQAKVGRIMVWQFNLAPSPAGEGRGEENKINYLPTSSSQPSPLREKGQVLSVASK
jgi:hypothetical protein